LGKIKTNFDLFDRFDLSAEIQRKILTFSRKWWIILFTRGRKIAFGGSMKKLFIFVLFISLFFSLGAQKKLNLADNERVLQIGALNDGSLVVLVKEETPGYISLLENSFLLIGNKKIKAMNTGLLQFFNKGSDFIYAGYEEDGISLISANGRSKKGPYSEIGSIDFSASANTLAFSVKIDNKYYVINGNTRIGPYNAIGDLLYIDNGKTLVYAAKLNEDWFIMKGKERIGPFAAVDKIKYFSENDSLVYAFQKDGGWYIQKDEKTIGLFSNVADFTYSPDMDSFAYAISKESNWFIVNGSETLGPFNRVGDISFSPDGKSIAYTVQMYGDWYVLVNNETAGPYDEIGPSLVFSPDNKKLAYMAKIDEAWYIINGLDKIGPFDDVDNIQFSKDGTAMSFHALIGSDVYTKLMIHSKIYTGFIVNDVLTYIDEGIIYSE